MNVPYDLEILSNGTSKIFKLDGISVKENVLRKGFNEIGLKQIMFSFFLHYFILAFENSK